MQRQWKIGELAAAVGLTVRTLHHFDRLGLVRPSVRSSAGHRRYTDVDIRRLYQVLALRHLGIALADIARTLDNDADLTGVVRAQVDRVEHDLSALRRLRQQLDAVSRALHLARDPSVNDLLATMEALMGTSYFTPEQLAQAKARHTEPGFAERIAGWQERGRTLSQQVSALLHQGTEPSDPAVQELARQWTELILELADGDRAGVAAMYAKIEGRGAEQATRGALTTEAWEFLKRAFAVGFGAPHSG